MTPIDGKVEITEADKRAAFQRRLAYMGKHGHYEDSEALLEEIEALKRVLRAGCAVAAPELLEALQELIFASTGLVGEAYLRDAREVVAKAESK